MIKAISLTQPWASLIAYGGKRIETRSWVSKYRGWLLIHAAQSYPMEAQQLVDVEPFRQVFGHYGITMSNAVHTDIPRGAVTAVARLVDIVPTILVDAGKVITAGGRDWLVTEQEMAFGDYSPGRHAWLLADVVKLTRPVMAKGRLGLWTPKAETMAAVERDLLGLAEPGIRLWHDLPDDWPKEWPKDA